MTSARAGFRPVRVWTDDRAWCRLVGEARRHDAKLSAVLRWGEAAGGVVTTPNGGVRLTLPPALPKGLALADLRPWATRRTLSASPSPSAWRSACN